MQDLKSFLKNLPPFPGVYQMLNNQEKIIYVGKAKNIKKRISSYFSGKQQDVKTQALLKHIVNIEITVTRSENEALLLECNLIKKYKPHYNVLFRDDKSYPYIVITQDHSFPRIDFYRGNKKKKGGAYFGPYPNKLAVRETIQLIQKLFNLRTCTDHFFKTRTRPCLLYQINRCTGPCASLIDQKSYEESVRLASLFLQGKNQHIIEVLTDKMELSSKDMHYEVAARYRDQILNLREIQKRQYVTGSQGNVDVIGVALQSGLVCLHMLVIRQGRILGSRPYLPSVPSNADIQEVLSSFIVQHYLGNPEQEIPSEIIIPNALEDVEWLENALIERASHKVKIHYKVRNERKKWLETALLNAKQLLATHLMNRTHLFERFNHLKEVLKLPEIPSRLECFDISHTMGEETVASCVVFDKNGPLKSDYRRFNISGITPGDDIAAMKQVLLRRYKHAQGDVKKIPDVILIDGGKSQLHAAELVMEELGIHEGVLLVGVAKGVTRKPGFETLIVSEQTPMHLPADSHALHLIQHIRDEAHRFAITGHRQRRDKKRHVSILESIPGVGAKRRRELLRYFGGIQAVNHASLDELIKVPGISRSLAERIFEALH